MKPPRVNLTVLDELINKAIGYRRKLRHLEEGRKLTFKAFMSEALKIADTDQETVDKLADTIKTAHGTRYIQGFVRKMVSVLRESNYPRCPDNPSKILNCYGSDAVSTELQGIDANVPMAVAVAVREVHRKFGDEAFGQIEDWLEYERKTKSLQDQISTIAEKMQDAVSGMDLEFSFDDLNSEAKRLGLCRVTFRRAPGVVLSDEGWPDRLITDCERPIPAEAISPTDIKVRKVHKRRLKRERLAA